MYLVDSKVAIIKKLEFNMKSSTNYNFDFFLRGKMALGEMKKKLQNIMVQNNFLENLAQDKNIRRMNNIVFSFIIFDTIVLCFDGTTLQRDDLIFL